MNQRQLLGAIGLVAEHLRRPGHTARAGKPGLGDPLDHMVLLQAVGDEVANRADLEAVGRRERHQIVEPGHRPVFEHDLANHARGVKPGEAGDIDRRLRMSCANQHAAGPGDKGEDVTGRHEVVPAAARVDRDGDSARAVGGGDTGGDAFARFDRDGESSFVARAVLRRHWLESELVDTVLG